jgi:hypothetical protein
MARGTITKRMATEREILANKMFIVDGFVQGEMFSVVGRCGDAPIHVGEVFDAVYRYKRRRPPDELGDEPVREVERPAAIRVVCIHAYGMSLEFLGEGMTGSLTLDGEGLQYIAPGWILGRKNEGSSVAVRDEKPAAV